MTTSLQLQNFSSMQAEVGRVVQDTSTTRKASIKDAINRALGIASEMFEWPQLLVSDESGLRYATDTTVATFETNDKYAVAPFGCGRIKGLINQTAGGCEVEIVSSDELFSRVGSMLTTVGKPQMAAIVGRTVQYIPMASAGVPKILCSSDANNNVKTVRVYVVQDGGQPGQGQWIDVTGVFSTLLSLTGATAAAGYSIEAVSLPAGWVGTLSITDRLGTQIGFIPTNELPSTGTNSTLITVSRPLLRLWPIPDADYAATWIWWRVPLRLTEDEDIPEIPISAFLVAKASAEIFAQMGKGSESQMWEGRAATYLKMASGQNIGTKNVQATPYMGNLVDQTCSGPRWSVRY